MNKDHRLKLEFALFLAIGLFALWQMAAFTWRAVATLF